MLSGTSMRTLRDTVPPHMPKTNINPLSSPKPLVAKRSKEGAEQLYTGMHIHRVYFYTCIYIYNIVSRNIYRGSYSIAPKPLRTKRTQQTKVKRKPWPPNLRPIPTEVVSLLGNAHDDLTFCIHATLYPYLRSQTVQRPHICMNLSTRTLAK